MMERKKKSRTYEMMTMSLRRHRPISSSANIQSLPQEVLLYIFSYLSLGDICNTLAKVCKQWERIHWDPELYSAPKVIEGERTTESLLTCLKVAPCLWSPYFDSVYIKKIIKQSLEMHNNLKRSKTGVKKFVYVFQKDLIIMLSHLSKVHLMHMSNSAGSKAITHLLSCCLQLEELKVFGNRNILINNQTLISLMEPLHSTLRVLHLDCDDWTVEGVKAITKCHLLEDLAIREARELTPEGLLLIANMSSLRHLKIQYCYQPSVRTWISVITNNAMKDLTTLHLHDCSYDDKVAVAIGNNLKNLTELSMMNRISCQHCMKRFVARKGLESIIKGCSKLTILEVDCGGNHPVVKTIVLIPEYLPGLKRLSTICRPFTSLKCKTQLKEMMPDLLIRERWR